MHPQSDEQLQVPGVVMAHAMAPAVGMPVASRFNGPRRRANPGVRRTPLVALAAKKSTRATGKWRSLIQAVVLDGSREWRKTTSAAWRRLLVRAVTSAQQRPARLPHHLAPAALLVLVLLSAAVGLHGTGRLAAHSTPASVSVADAGVTAPVVSVLASPVVEQPPAPTFHAVDLPSLSEERAPAAPSAERLLSEASTMDLMMPIAEPDLDISSRHSLWAQVGKAYGIDPLLLYSVALVESKSLYPDGRVAPTPWLFRVDDHLVRGDRQHVQLQMAAASQFGSGVQDVGIMQVYYPMHRDAVRDPLTLLDPRTNITVGAKILRDGMHRTRDRVMGVGYYHSRTPSLAKGYGTAVLTVYERLKATHRKSRKQAPLAR